MTLQQNTLDTTAQAMLFDLAEGEGDWPDYEETPLLLVDTDPERAVARQKEMMDTVFGGIGEETKAEKRMGLAMQQLDVENRHALRLLLLFQDANHLTTHLQRCLADPVYGYGPDGRGDQGRTIAQAMAAVGGTNLAEVAANWLAAHRELQQRLLHGTPFSFRSLFDYADLDTFVPLVQRTGDQEWRLGVEGQGKAREFHGPVEQIWPPCAIPTWSGVNRTTTNGWKQSSAGPPGCRTASSGRPGRTNCARKWTGCRSTGRVSSL